MKRGNMSPEDLLKFRFLSGPSISPDGRSICYSVHKADLEKNRYDSRLWLHILDSGENRPLTGSGWEKFFCWNNDGEEIVFASDRKDPEKGTTDLYAIALGGGEAQPIGSLTFAISSIVHLGGNRYLLSGEDPRESEKLAEADYMVFEQVPFCSNGKGYTAQKRTALYIYERGGEARKLTPDTLDVDRYRLSPDKTKVLITGPDFTDVRPIRSGLRELDLKTGEIDELIPDGAFACKCADYLDESVVLTGSKLDRHGINENVAFHVLKDGVPREITPGLDRGLRNSVGCDCRYGTSDLNLAFFVDSGKIWFVSTDGIESHLHSLDLSGKIVQETEKISSVDDYHVSGRKAAVIGLKGLALQELYIVESGEERRVSGFNGWTTSDRILSVPEPLASRSDPGCPIDGWIMKPTDYREGERYPAIIHIHGGPKTAFGEVYFHEMQLWAARGYVVAFCNPRGSDGKGNDFDDIRGKYGTVDYEDIMAFTDEVEKLPFVDEDRMGVTGGSYGGYMTNWIIGHTDRFKAAVSQRSISNWISKAGISDIGYYFVPDQQDADIWDDVEKLWWHSPLKYADRATTPTLFIHSDEDYRCELSQGLQMFTALKRHGVGSKICVFKGENHELSRGGKPRERLARLEEISRWFDRYLKD
ncbi:S9 family peptidase [Dethiosulfovibrio peptidovorans]|nr:S9 family peptidase [Dethiosulfovibrio peptidovorans]